MKKPWYKNWIVWVAIVIVLGVVGMFMPKSDEQKQIEQEVQEQVADAEAKAQEAAEQAQQAAEEAAEHPTLEELIVKNQETLSPQHPDFLTLQFGDLEEATINEGTNGNTLIIKVSFPDGGWNNDSRKEQSFMNVVDLVRNQGAGVFDAIDYWAVEPLVDSITGEATEPQKVISFTITKDAITGIENQVILPTNIEEKGVLQDYWIHPAMQG